jgi:hypothetical protein
MKKIMVKVFVLLFAGLAGAQNGVDFSKAPYVGGDVVKDSGQIDAGEKKLLVRTLRGASAAIAEVDGQQVLQIKTASDTDITAAFIQDAAPVLMGGDIFRSVEFQVDGTGDGAGIIIALVNADEAKGQPLNILSYRKNIIVELDINFAGGNLILLVRRTGIAGMESLIGRRWIAGQNQAVSRLKQGRFYRAELSYQQASQTIGYRMVDVNRGDEICSGQFALLEVSPDIVGQHAARFVIGDPFSNSAKGWAYSVRKIDLDPIQTVSN